jgi:aspartyl/asparaginyl-tRNA synthetase
MSEIEDRVQNMVLYQVVGEQRSKDRDRAVTFFWGNRHHRECNRYMKKQPHSNSPGIIKEFPAELKVFDCE